jgi:hypothetical protein
MMVSCLETDAADPVARRFSFWEIKGMTVPNPEGQFIVIMTERGVACEHPRRKRECVEWDEINEIGILTTDEGPFAPDFWLLLIGDGKGVSVPQGAKRYEELYDRISRFPGFNYESVIKASVSTENARFICWKRKDTREGSA